MTSAQVDFRHYELQDGLGDRWIAQQAPHGLVEVLCLSPELAGHAGAEPAIRARAARLEGVEIPALTVVRRVERDTTGVRVVADAASGTRLSDLLAHLESNGEILPEDAVMELAGRLIGALASIHALPGCLAHGALTPAHVVLGPDGTVVLTDSLFGAALESLQWNRERLWRAFQVALPASASLPRFDQRTDVTQLGAVVLAIALSRSLRSDEYPRFAMELVVHATRDARSSTMSALRMWLLQALHLQGRALFTSAVDAERRFAQIAPAPGVRRVGAKAISALLKERRTLVA
jgi:hypothetical protein